MITSEFCNAMKDQHILVATHYLHLDTSHFVQDMCAMTLLPPGAVSVSVCQQALSCILPVNYRVITRISPVSLILVRGAVICCHRGKITALTRVIIFDRK